MTPDQIADTLTKVHPAQATRATKVLRHLDRVVKCEAGWIESAPVAGSTDITREISWGSATRFLALTAAIYGLVEFSGETYEGVRINLVGWLFGDHGRATERDARQGVRGL